MFLKFEKYFGDIFGVLTGGGKSDVRLIRNQERSRGMVRLRNSITIKVSFDGETVPSKRWIEFSGGQKTVVAVSLLMALQKCEPAPYYILDEIDAALDPVYLRRIVELIMRESNTSQYFISTFKKEMLNFPEEICNYYLVENVERISKIRRVTQAVANDMIEDMM